MFLPLIAAAANVMALPSVDAEALRPDFKAEFNEGGAAATEVRLTVSPSGAVIRCERGFVNGPPENADAFCSMLNRVHFRPARDNDGHAAYGVGYVWSHWSNRHWVSNDLPRWDPVNLALTSNKMPKGFADGSIFTLVLDVDSNGLVGSCAALAPRQTRIPSDIVNLLCREASAQPVSPAMDEAASAVPSIQEFFVRLTSQQAIDRVLKKVGAH